MMTHFWEKAFVRSQMMWGAAPTRSAEIAADDFAERGVESVLIPGIGYGRNAKPFLAKGMVVTGIEVSETAIALAREKMDLEIPIHHGSVTDMPFDDRSYGGIFCFGLLYLLDAAERAKLLADCRKQLAPGGRMMFTVVSKQFERYGKGTKLGEDWYEVEPGVRMYFYDDDSIRREFGPHGLTKIEAIDEPMPNGSLRPFINVICAAGPNLIDPT